MNKRRDVSEQAKRAIVAFRSHCRSSEVNLLLHSVARCLMSFVGHSRKLAALLLAPGAELSGGQEDLANHIVWHLGCQLLRRHAKHQLNQFQDVFCP